MKRENEVVVVAACRPMTGVLSPANYQSQPQFPTPSPFSSSVVTAGSIHVHGVLVFRFLGLVFSFVSALSLAAASSSKKKDQVQHPSSFNGYSELMYLFIASILVFIYSAFQLFKGVCDIADRGIFISDKISDYLSFILDQLAGYLLISSTSVAIMGIGGIENSTSLREATIVSITMCFAAFLLVAVCSLFSGYKLCKRIMW